MKRGHQGHFSSGAVRRGVVHSMMNKCNKAQKAMAKDFDTPVLVRYVIDGD